MKSSSTINFKQIDYLKEGNERQKLAFLTLVEHDVFPKLRDFSPILTGTIPIAIDIPTSDLDIICCWANKEDFIHQVKKSFSMADEFELRTVFINQQETVITTFKLNDFEVEIFAQAIPTTLQNAYRHLCIEQQILLEKGEEFRHQIIALKRKGYKTEPAFAQLLKLEGDPYVSLLAYTVKDKDEQN